MKEREREVTMMTNQGYLQASKENMRFSTMMDQRETSLGKGETHVGV